MLTDDKIKAGEEFSEDSNINTRDQNRSGIILLVLLGLFVAGLVGLGMSHAPAPVASEPAPAQGAAPLQSGEPANDYDVRTDIGPVELPGTVGKPQNLLKGHGNTPVTAEQAGGPEAAAAPKGDEHEKKSETVAPAGH